MHKILTALAVAATMIVAAVAVPDTADARWRGRHGGYGGYGGYYGGALLGGLAAGAIIGGLIIGVGEKLAEVYIGPQVGGGIEIWFGYVLVLFVLLVRPQGLFGGKPT